MKSCSSWEEFSKLSAKYPCKCNTRYKITLSGYFSPWTEYGKPVPDEAVVLSRSLEDILKTGFTGLSIGAIETPLTPNPAKPETRYSSLYVGVGDGICQMNCSLRVAHMKNKDKSTAEKNVFYPCQPKFFMILPLEQYQEQTKTAITSLWGLIEAFSHVETSPPVNYRYGAFGPQEIMISDKGNPIIIGHTAIQRLGLQLDPKEARNKDYVMNVKR